MGLLERWDRRNQETAEYHNETAPGIDEMASHVIGKKFWLWYIASWIASGLLGVSLRLSGLSDNDTDAVRIAILGAISVSLLIAGCIQARRKRARWREDRSQR